MGFGWVLDGFWMKPGCFQNPSECQNILDELVSIKTHSKIFSGTMFCFTPLLEEFEETWLQYWLDNLQIEGRSFEEAS